MFDRVEAVAKRHNRYPIAAYLLIFETIDWIQRCGIKRHLTGKELSFAVFAYSINRYGLLARTVWENLNIKRSEDLGNIVYHLLDDNLMLKEPTDKQSDFDLVLSAEQFDRVTIRAEVKEEIIEGKRRWGFDILYDIPPEWLAYQ